MNARHRIHRILAASIATMLAGAGLVVAGAQPAAAAPGTVTGATFEWRFSDETNAAAFNGQCNFWSAGKSDGTAATYTATNGNATVLKLNAAGGYDPISGYASRCLDRTGQPVNTVNGPGARRLGQKVRFTGGTGTLDPATGAATIQWTGTFSINFYGTLVPFWIVNPKLTVDAAGNGTVTATVGGYASDQSNPDVRVLLPDTPNVVIATLRGVASANTTGFTSTPVYEGVVYDADPKWGQAPQNRTTPGWGSWPTSFVDFQMQAGLGSYWYTSGGQADVRKPPFPITVGYGTFTPGQPTVSASNCIAQEAASCTFQVTLSAPQSAPVTVQYATQTGTAGSADFTARSGTLTFSAGTTSRSVAVALTDDDLTEPNETFSLVLSNPSGAVLGGNGTGTIQDGTIVVTAQFSAGEAATVAQSSSFYGEGDDPLRFGARLIRFFDILSQPGGLEPWDPIPPSSGTAVTLTARYTQAEGLAMYELAGRLGAPIEALHIGGVRVVNLFWFIDNQ